MLLRFDVLNGYFRTFMNQGNSGFRRRLLLIFSIFIDQCKPLEDAVLTVEMQHGAVAGHVSSQSFVNGLSHLTGNCAIVDKTVQMVLVF